MVLGQQQGRVARAETSINSNSKALFQRINISSNHCLRGLVALSVLSSLFLLINSWSVATTNFNLHLISVKGLERGLFGAPGWIQVRSGSGFGLLIGGLEWI